jgi:hypothetical protein
LADRFANVDELRASLARLRDPPTDGPDIRALACELRERASSDLSRRQRLRSKSLDEAWNWLSGILADASRTIDSEFVPVSSENYDPNTDHPWRNMGLHHHYRGHHMRFWLQTTCRFVGSELVITIGDERGGNAEQILRTDAEAPNFSHGDRDRMIARLLVGVESLNPI